MKIINSSRIFEGYISNCEVSTVPPENLLWKPYSGLQTRRFVDVDWTGQSGECVGIYAIYIIAESIQLPSVLIETCLIKIPDLCLSCDRCCCNELDIFHICEHSESFRFTFVCFSLAEYCQYMPIIVHRVRALLGFVLVFSQDYFTGPGAIIWLPQSQWSNHEGYW